MNKAVFLDRDGTINVDKGYVYRIADFEFLPGVIEGLKLLQATGYLLIVITNQSGIARGYYTVEDYETLTEHMILELKKHGVMLTDIFYCPHLPQAIISKYRIDCGCRKPKLGLFYKAIDKWNIDINNSWAIGDKERDCAICMETRCKGIIVNSSESKSAYYYAKNFFEAATYIVEHEI